MRWDRGGAGTGTLEHYALLSAPHDPPSNGTSGAQFQGGDGGTTTDHAVKRFFAQAPDRQTHWPRRLYVVVGGFSRQRQWAHRHAWAAKLPKSRDATLPGVVAEVHGVFEITGKGPPHAVTLAA